MRRFALAVSLSAAVGCAEEMDTTRIERPGVTVGQAVYRDVCQRLARDAFPEDFSGAITRGTCEDGVTPPPGSGARLQALHGQRRRFIAAVDSALAPPFNDEVAGFLQDLLPLYDNQVMQRQTDALDDFLALLERDEAALGALERLAIRQGYTPSQLQQGLKRPIFAYDRLDALTRATLTPLLRTSDGRAALDGLFAALGDELEAGVRIEPDGALAELRKTLMREDVAFTDGEKRYITLRDGRGLVQPATAGGGMVGPFSDADGDGLADVDALGKFVDSQGRTLSLGAPFRVPNEPAELRRDDYGRLLSASGGLVYRYVDGSRTLLAGLLEQTQRIANASPGALTGLLRPMADVADPNGALVDLVHAMGPVLGDPVMAPMLEAVVALIGERESQIAPMAGALLEGLTTLREPKWDGKSLKAKNNFVDDMILLGADILRVPGLAEDLAAALRDPASKALGKIFADYMRYKDPIDVNLNDFNGPPLGRMVTPVDRTKPDGAGNRSIFQRFTHLVHDTAGVPLCNKEGATLDLGFAEYPFWGTYAACELFEIEDMAVFYAESIIGRAHITLKDSVVAALPGSDFVMETMSGITGYTLNPTPQALNRFLFAPRNGFSQKLIDAPLTGDGGVLEVRHKGTIFAWELAGFYEAIAPIVRAFSDHGRTDLFTKALTVMHKHYGSDESGFTQSRDKTATLYADNSGAVRFEEMIVDLLERGALLDKLIEAAVAADAIRVTGVSAEAYFIEAARLMMLPERHPGLTTRDGRARVMKGDGVTAIDDVSPALLALRAARKLDAAITDQAVREDFEDAMYGVMRTMLAVENRTTSSRFASAITPAVMRTMMDVAREHVALHRDEGDLAVWAKGLDDDLAELLAEPLVQSLVSVTDRVLREQEARAEIEGLLAYLTQRSGAHRAFDSTLVCSLDLLQELQDDGTIAPFFEALAPVFAPNGLAIRGAEAMLAINEKDRNRVLPRLLSRLSGYATADSVEAPMQALLDVALIVNREAPGSEGPLRAKDYARVLKTIREFLNDEERGLERMYDLVENR